MKGRIGKRRIGWWLLAVVLACSSTVHAGVTGRLVYLGLDPSSNQHGGNDDQRFQLAGNAVRWVGQNNDPTTAFVNGSGGFGSETGFLLALAGLTDLTEILVQDLDTADLSGFEALYIGPRTAGVADLVAAAANVLSFAQSGGGLVVEPNVFDPESWSWVPFADQIGHSGDQHVTSNDVTIVDGSHPVMQGLTSAGLSDWVDSVHSVFSSPGAAEFDELAIDSGITGLAVIIARGGGEPTGGCCFDDFSCEQVTGTECDSAGGTYQGDGTNCDDCPLPPTGACCFEDGTLPQTLVYSHEFGSGVTYCPGDPQYDDWLSYRASLPTEGVLSVNVSGSQDPTGRTCSDPDTAQQIADAMRTGASLSVACGPSTWDVAGQCQADGCAQLDNDLVISAGGGVCGCSSTYVMRPGIGNSNWGGITGGSCDPPTQTMTVTIEVAGTGNCLELTESECATAGGVYQGDNTNCENGECPAPGDCSGFPCGNGKVLICHVPPGNPDNPRTICISENAVPGHFANHQGDHCGPCEEGLGARDADPLSF